MKGRVVVSQTVFPELLAPLEDAGYEVVVRDLDAPAETEVLVRLVEGADALICLLTDRIDAAVLGVESLRVVATVAAGYDNIDVAEATRQGVAVCNTPDALTESTADLAMALMLAAARRVPEGDAYLRAGKFTRWQLLQPQIGLDVGGRSLGILGFGKIGRAVARRASAGFGMSVRYHSRRRAEQGLEAEAGARWSELPELIGESDFISLHVPLTPATRHLIDEGTLRSMKPSAVLINTARGPVVDEAALATALEQGWIAGAGLDVYEEEPKVHPRLLALRDRVVLLPHLGSATVSTRRRMVSTAVTNALDVLEGRRPEFLVNPEVVERR